MFRTTGQVSSLIIGVGWGLVFGFALSGHSLFQKLELNVYDCLLRWRHPQNFPSSILIVEINEEDLQKQVSFPGRQRIFYASLVNRLLEAGASVVVSNLPYHWAQTPDSDWIDAEKINRPLQELIQNHSDQIVLVTPVNPLVDTDEPKLRVYHHFLPLKNKEIEPLIVPESIQGFFEYNIEGNNPTRMTSTARRASLWREFVRADNLEQNQSFESFAVVALKKYNQQGGHLQADSDKDFLSSQTTIGINFWGGTGTFPRLDLKMICVSSENGYCNTSAHPSGLAQVRGKIVIVGFTQGNNFNTMLVQSPFGDKMPAIEVQANLLASLLTKSFYLSPPQWLKSSIVILGAAIVSGAIAFGCETPNPSHRRWIGLIVVTVFGYSCLSFIFFSQHITFPLVLPLLIWTGSGITAFLCTLVRRQHNLIIQQQLEIERHLAAEQAAALSQAQKILTRTADDIHDGPLQELKLVMDDLELLQLGHSTVDIDATLDKLENIGYGLRSSLENTRIMAEKLKVTPELRLGLVGGIRLKLKQLRDAGTLTLNLIQKLQPLVEPKCNSDWIDAREDIFRFFNEAIANVIYHAQPPHGTATYVKVSLFSQETKCRLVVENDGYERNDKKHNGGYGTKLMSAIAAKLPFGKWERKVLSEGRIQVELTWEQNFNDLKSLPLNVHCEFEANQSEQAVRITQS